MKKVIIAITIYFLLLHVVLPGIYYFIYGFTPIYSNFEDTEALIKSFFLLFIPFVASIVILYFIPSNNDQIEPNIEGNPLTSLFYFSIIFKLGIILVTGGFSAALSGENNGGLSNYISLFLNPFTLLLAMLLVQKKKSNALMAIFFYVFSVTLSGSRSGIISIFFVFLIGLGYESFKHYKRKVSGFLKWGLIVAPFLFIFATQLRGIGDFISLDVILNQIFGRMSALETTMMPVYHYDHDLNLDLFYEKYSVWHQFKLCFDSIVPGQLFDFDVMPNNYYRAIFMDYSESFVFENYMSVNLCLPTYLYLKYGYLAFFLTILYVLGFYKFTTLFRKYPLIIIVLLSGFYNLIYFFDWVMIVSQIYTGLLTVFALKMYVFFRKEFVNILRKDGFRS